MFSPPTDISRPYVPFLVALNERGIEWDKVAPLRSEGTNVYVSLPYIELTVIFSSAEMATRAAYAMEVIRGSCDPTRTTGF